jgi:hypothetical protein
MYRSAVFYFDSKGQMGMLDRGQVPFRSVPYQSNHWYQIELTFNWASQKVDCRIDGALVITNVSFPDSVTSMDTVLLANQDNTTSWWDDICVFNDNATNTFSLSPSNFTAFVNGVKSNLVTITGFGTNTFLTADDGLEHVGKSGLFNLLPVNLTLITPASVNEGNAPTNVRVIIPVAFPQPVTVTLTSTVPAKLTVPGSVAIPANQTNANFTLTIVDDAILDWIKPVFLIASGTNLVSATNVISVVDNDPPFSLLQCGRRTDGRFQINLQGPPGRNFAVLASTNLTDWDSILNFNFTNTPFIFTDPASTNLDWRFYRITPAGP